MNETKGTVDRRKKDEKVRRSKRFVIPLTEAELDSLYRAAVRLKIPAAVLVRERLGDVLTTS